MKSMPHDRRAIIYLNALEEAAEKVPHSQTEKEHLNTISAESVNEEREVQSRGTTSLDDQLAGLGMELSHAVIENRTTDAARIEKEFHEAAQNHPVASVMSRVPQIIKEHSVPGYDYRNWKGTAEGIDFGVIEAELADDATIGIIGDWGTGDPDAQALLQELKDNHNPDIIIHLGDIYRSCRYHKDVLPNFIDIINNVYPSVNGKATRPPILTIAGNHDYMSNKGHGFFKLLDTVNNHHPKWKQQASYFCLRTKSKKWQFLGADTGINDPSFTHKNSHPGLEPDEYTWHFDKMKNFASKGKGRTIFMTHHPLFSAIYPLENNEYVNQELASNLDGYLTNGAVQPDEIRLWMWGHNHWFIPYKSGATVNKSSLDKGRLIGGSARHDLHNTSEITKSGKHVIEYKRNGAKIPLLPDFNNGLPNHTYAVIKLSDADAEVTHYQTPSWKADDLHPVKKLPSDQHAVLLREYVLNTQPMEKYPPH